MKQAFVGSEHRTRMKLLPATDLVGYRGMFRDFVDAVRHNAEPRFGLGLARRARDWKRFCLALLGLASVNTKVR